MRFARDDTEKTHFVNFLTILSGLDQGNVMGIEYTGHIEPRMAIEWE